MINPETKAAIEWLRKFAAKQQKGFETGNTWLSRYIKIVCNAAERGEADDMMRVRLANYCRLLELLDGVDDLDRLVTFTENLRKRGEADTKGLGTSADLPENANLPWKIDSKWSDGLNRYGVRIVNSLGIGVCANINKADARLIVAAMNSCRHE